MTANALRCPHGRAWEACIRCDPSCPRGLPEEQYAQWQATYDNAHDARMRVALQQGNEGKDDTE